MGAADNRPMNVRPPSDNHPRYQLFYGAFFFCLVEPLSERNETNEGTNEQNERKKQTSEQISHFRFVDSVFQAKVVHPHWKKTQLSKRPKERTNRGTNKRTSGRPNEQTKKRMNKRTNERADGTETKHSNSLQKQKMNGRGTLPGISWKRKTQHFLAFCMTRTLDSTTQAWRTCPDFFVQQKLKNKSFRIEILRKSREFTFESCSFVSRDGYNHHYCTTATAAAVVIIVSPTPSGHLKVPRRIREYNCNSFLPAKSSLTSLMMVSSLLS